MKPLLVILILLCCCGKNHVNPVDSTDVVEPLPDAVDSTDVVEPLPYDVKNFFIWSEAKNNAGEICVVFVEKNDLSADGYVVHYQKYKNNLKMEDDVIFDAWKKQIFIENHDFDVALDDNGYAHFVCGGENDDCLYLTNSPDLKWKTRHVLSPKYPYRFGRTNKISLDGNRIDIVTSADYTVGGGYIFSVMFRIKGEIGNSPLEESLITANVAIYGEYVYNFEISNRYNRLIIIYSLSLFGGRYSSRIICSVDYLSSDKFIYKELENKWGYGRRVCIINEEESQIIVSVEGNNYLLFIKNGEIISEK